MILRLTIAVDILSSRPHLNSGNKNIALDLAFGHRIARIGLMATIGHFDAAEIRCPVQRRRYVLDALCANLPVRIRDLTPVEALSLRYHINLAGGDSLIDLDVKRPGRFIVRAPVGASNGVITAVS